MYIITGLDQLHGLAIKDELEEYYVKEVHHGRLYPDLDTLVEKELVEKSEKDRRTNEYKLTKRGRREIDAHQDWEVNIRNTQLYLGYNQKKSGFAVCVRLPAIPCNR